MIHGPSSPYALHCHSKRLLCAVCVLILFGSLLPVAAVAYPKEVQKRIAELPAEYQQWLGEVEFIISEQELEAFFALEKDYQRNAFIDRFWRVRDTYPDTARNEFKERWYETLDVVRERFGTTDSEAAKLVLLNGEPEGILEVEQCDLLYDLQIWFYGGSQQVHFDFFLIFYRFNNQGLWRVWRPSDGLEAIVDTFSAKSDGRQSLAAGRLLSDIQLRCRDGDIIATALASVLREGMNYESLLARMSEKPEGPTPEWVATFASYSTELPEEAKKLPATLSLEFPGRRQNRTLVQGLLTVPVAASARAELGEHRSYNFLLNGEVLHEEGLFDTFRYKFDLPAAEVRGETIPLIFERFLRPGSYRLLLRLEDINGQAYYREERVLEVPRVEEAILPPADAETARQLAEANAAITSGETTLELVEPTQQILTGYVRFDTLTTGQEIARVEFSLDGQSVLVKRRPPYSVELDLGEIPRARTLAATGYDAEGAEVARDELLINAGGSRFSIDLIEPRKGKTYTESLRAEARVETPEGTLPDRVEFYLNETLVATLYQEPWVQPILLPKDEYLAYVRAVAYLPDGNSTEDLVFVNAPDYQEEIDIQYVELYAAVLDKSSRPVSGLSRADFQPIEDGVAQEISRFEVVESLPIHAGVLLDISGSMEEGLAEAQQAALAFFEQAIEPRDRGTLMTFNDRPNLTVKFTNDVKTLAGGLAGLKAERGTALYDSIIFSLYYFNGVRGQKALLVLSDGKDESSKFSFEDALDYARRAGVTIYTVALRDDVAHKKLARIAEETGGRSFFVQDAAELPGIYETIQKELRSRYLVAYQSKNTSGGKEFRTVELKVQRPGVEVKTIRGYYP